MKPLQNGHTQTSSPHPGRQQLATSFAAASQRGAALCGRESPSGVITTADRNISSGCPCLDHICTDHCAHSASRDTSTLQFIPRSSGKEQKFFWEMANKAYSIQLYSNHGIMADIGIPSQKPSKIDETVIDKLTPSKQQTFPSIAKKKDGALLFITMRINAY